MKNYEFLIKLLKNREFKKIYMLLKLNAVCPVEYDESFCDKFKNCEACWINWLVCSYAKSDEVKY